MRREITIEIRHEYPDWVEEAGACKRCWESFRGVVRVVRFMNNFRFPKRWCTQWNDLLQARTQK